MSLSFNKLGAFLFWTPLFALRIFMGGEAVDYSEFSQIPLRGLGYICNALLVALAVLKWQQNRSRQPSLLVSALGIIVILVAHYLVAGLIVPKILTASYLPFLRGLLWVAACIAYGRLLFRADSFISVYLGWAFATATLALTSLLFWRSTGIPINVLISDGAPRIQGMLSEPSALAYACAPAAGLFFHRKQFAQFAVSITAIALSYSVIAVAAGLVILGLALLSYWSGSRLVKLYLAACLVTVLMVPLVLSFSGQIARVSADLLERIPKDAEAGLFYRRVVERPLATLILIDERLENPSEESAGSAERLLALNRLFGEMRNDGVFWYGYGLNTFGNFWLSTHPNSILDYGAVPFFISSFGLAAAALMLVPIFVRTYRLYFLNRELSLLVFGVIIATSYNSAGGLLVYSPLVLMLINIGRPAAGHSSHAARERSAMQRTTASHGVN